MALLRRTKNVEAQRVSTDTPAEMVRKADISLLDDDKEINKKIDAWLKNSQTLFDTKKKHWKDNESWFKGEQWKNEKLEFQSDTVINRIFPAVRNMVGMATDQRPAADIMAAPADVGDMVTQPPTPEEMQQWQQAAMQAQQTGQQPPQQPQGTQVSRAEINKLKADKLKQLLDQRWEDMNMQEFVGKSLYHTFIYDDAYWMPYWDFRDDDFSVELIRPEDVRIDTSGHSIAAARYVIFRPWKNKKWVEENYPEKLPFIKFGTGSTADDKEEDTERVRIDDVWTDYVRVIRIGQVVLEKMSNPLFEFRTEEEQLQAFQAAGNDPQGFRPRKNYFKNPRKPLIMLPVCNIGEVYSESLMDQLKPVQRSMDKRKQQIDENASQMANGQWVYDVNYLSKDEAAMLTAEPGLQIGIDGIDHIRKTGGEEMPGYIMRDLEHSQEIFDNIMGHHDISRGAKVMTQTATESSILSENDRVSVRSLIRNYEYSIQQLYEWWLQMISMFYTEDKYVRVLGQGGTQTFFTVNNTDVSDGINIKIRPGSTLPQDRASLRADVVQLSQMDMIDPLTMMETLGIPEPDKAVQRLMAWRQGFYPDTTPDEMQKIMQQRQEQSQTAAEDPKANIKQTINFKDLPSTAQEQVLASIGIDMTPGVTSPVEKALAEGVMQMQQQQMQQQGGQDMGQTQ